MSDQLPTGFDSPDLPSQVTLDTGRAPIDLPSVLRPWDARPILALSGFARETVAARARLALEDPGNERGAVAPLSSVRARWILGGTNEIGNLRTLCYRCNLIKGGSMMSDADVLAARLATSPVARPGRGPFGPVPVSIFSRRPRPYR